MLDQLPLPHTESIAKSVYTKRNMKVQSEKTITACRNEDQQALESQLREHDIGPDQPQSYCRNAIPEEQRTLTIDEMLAAAIAAQQIDMISFLSSKFPKISFDQGPLPLAIDTDNVQLVETMCKVDPASANEESSYVNVLASICGTPGSETMVSVLLKAGADPNKPAAHTPPWSNAYYAVRGKMPVSICEEFFDHGYCFDDDWALHRAIDDERLEIVEVLLRRGRVLPTARIDPLEDLIERAQKNKDWEMVKLIHRLHPDNSKKRGTGFVGAIYKMLKLK